MFTKIEGGEDVELSEVSRSSSSHCVSIINLQTGGLVHSDTKYFELKYV